MNKYIAVTAALVVVFFTLVPQGKQWAETYLTHVSIPARVDAWQTFAAYRDAANKHDLDQLANVAYKLSPECKVALTDSSKIDPCYQLMDSVAFFTSSFRELNFTNVAEDDKQTVISTDYLKSADPASDSSTKTVIYFVRDGQALKVLGIRFCYKTEKESGGCVNTDPATRDSNKNGWWDDVEVLFKK